jgi:glycosyltransferase involved in cell wall biosynthesis
LHTPAALDRYRLSAGRSVMIRQPGHEESEVIGASALEERLASLNRGRPLRLATACRHSALKGLDLLIGAIGLLAERGVHVQATLYGKGPDTANLQRLATQLGVADRVRFGGSLAAGEELDRALRNADLFMMPHRTTDFGRAFFDAMAAGLPVGAFRTAASTATVYEGRDGFLCPLDDVQGLAELIAALDRDRSALIAAARGARRRALENTRTEWFRMRAAWTLSLFPEDANAAA